MVRSAMMANESAVIPLRETSPAELLRPPIRADAWTWTVLFFLAFSTRLVAAFILPNAEQDGYSYAEIITRWSSDLSTGHFRLTDLFGFWLPLFQLATAVPNIWIGNSLLAGKIVSALCGAMSCLLVFAITKRLTRSVFLAWLGFAFLVLSPLHILYSAACMTDVPEGCLILASLWFVTQRRWLLAAIFGALAEGVRVEPWVLVIVLPLLQLAYERRISMLSLAILLLPPLVWLGLGQLATGDPLAFLARRARYQASYMDFHLTRHGFTVTDLRQDIEYFLLGVNRGVVIAGIVAGVLSISRAVHRHRRPPLAVTAILAYAAALGGFIFFAYLTKRQPVLLPRYGLMFFSLGLPLLLWLFQCWFRPSTLSWMPKLLSVAAMAICLWEAKRQLPTIPKVFADHRAHRQIAEMLATAFQQSPDFDQRCFSDDAAVRVLSRLPADRFLRSETTVPSAGRDASSFESYLRREHVRYLVFMNIEDSLPAKFYPDLRQNAQADTSIFQVVAFAPSPFGPNVGLFRLRDDNKAR